MEQSRYYKNYWLVFAVSTMSVIIVAAIFWARANPYGVHWDEAQYLNEVGLDVKRLWAGKLLTVGGRILIKNYGRPPAYRILALPFLAIFGFHIVVARLVSLTCFAFSSWFVYLATRQIAGSIAGAFATLVFMLSPEVVSASIFFGTDASLYLATSALLYYVFVSWRDDSDASKSWIGLGLAMGLGFLAKTTFLLIGFPVIAFWMIAGHYGWLDIPNIKAQKKAGTLALLIAGPWWLLNGRKSFGYASYARGFVRDSLGSPSIGTWMRWFNTVIKSLLGHGVAIFIGLVLISCLIAAIKSRLILGTLPKAALIACACAGLPIVLEQISGTNHLLRHITPAMIPLAISIGVLAEESGWAGSWWGALTASILFCGQLIMLVAPVVFPNSHQIDLAFPTGVYPWQAMIRFDQWDWTRVRNISQSCGLDVPKIAYLGDGRAFNLPQIEYSWISKGQAPPEVTWLWRYENGVFDWQKTMDAADQNDIVITAPGFIGEVKEKEDLDNQYNSEFADRLSRDSNFRHPTMLAMGRFEPVQVLVFVKSALVCRTASGSSIGQ